MSEVLEGLGAAIFRTAERHAVLAQDFVSADDDAVLDRVLQRFGPDSLANAA